MTWSPHSHRACALCGETALVSRIQSTRQTRLQNHPVRPARLGQEDHLAGQYMQGAATAQEGSRLSRPGLGTSCGAAGPALPAEGCVLGGSTFNEHRRVGEDHAAAEWAAATAQEGA